MTESNDDPRHWRNWISAGDILTASAMMVAMAAGWGSLSKDVDVLRADIAEIKSQRMTSGAAEAIAAMTQRDQAQDRELADLRLELRQQRTEILAGLEKLEAQLQAHSRER